MGRKYSMRNSLVEYDEVIRSRSSRLDLIFCAKSTEIRCSSTLLILSIPDNNDRVKLFWLYSDGYMLTYQMTTNEDRRSRVEE